MPGSAGFVRPAILAIWLIAITAPPGSAEGTPDDAFSMLREEQTVTGATKRPQPLS